MQYVIQYLRQEEKGKTPDQLFPSARAGSIQQHKEFVNNVQGMAADRDNAGSEQYEQMRGRR